MNHMYQRMLNVKEVQKWRHIFIFLWKRNVERLKKWKRKVLWNYLFPLIMENDQSLRWRGKVAWPFKNKKWSNETVISSIEWKTQKIKDEGGILWKRMKECHLFVFTLHPSPFTIRLKWADYLDRFIEHINEVMKKSKGYKYQLIFFGKGEALKNETESFVIRFTGKKKFVIAVDSCQWKWEEWKRVK